MEAPGKEGRSKGGKGRKDPHEGREGPKSWMDQGKKAEGRSTREGALSLVNPKNPPEVI